MLNKFYLAFALLYLKMDVFIDIFTLLTSFYFLFI